MPPLKSVQSMQKCASQVILDLVHRKFLHLEENQNTGEWGRDLYDLLYSSNPPAFEHFFYNLIELLQKQFTQAPALRPKIRALISSMVGPHLQSLDLESLSVSFDKVLMKDIYKKFDGTCRNLETLVLGRSFYFCSDILLDLNSKLQQLSKLMRLHIHHVATSGMLENIGVHCPRLVVLSVRGSDKVCDLAVPHILGCKNLKTLDIQGTKISGEGRKELIEKSTRIETIEHCPFNCDTDFRVFKSRAEIFDLIKAGYNNQGNDDAREIFPTNPYRLKNFWLSNPKSDEVEFTLVFSDLQILRLDFVFQDFRSFVDVQPLKNLKSLQTLDLNFYDSANNDLFRRIIEACGERLTKLVYNVFAKYSDIVDCHNMIATQCPNLTSLSFQGDFSYNTLEDPETDARLIARSPGSPGFLNKLEELSLGGHCTNGRLAWLLASAAGIKQILLDGNLEALTDSAWLAIFMDNKLEELETVWINTSTEMGLESINLLINNCPKLKRVGRLVNLSDKAQVRRKAFYAELVQRRIEENLDVDLVWVSPKQTYASTVCTQPC